jgi:hypothetical protein
MTSKISLNPSFIRKETGKGVGEALIYEILGANVKRLPDKASGFSLMEM